MTLEALGRLGPERALALYAGAGAARSDDYRTALRRYGVTLLYSGDSVRGLAMLRVLQGAFVASFGSGRFTLGALISLLVTVADLGVWNIGAAFWGLVAGFAVSWLMEKADFVALANKD